MSRAWLAQRPPGKAVETAEQVESSTSISTITKSLTAFTSISFTALYALFLDPTWHVNDDVWILSFAAGTLDGNATWQVPFLQPSAGVMVRAATALVGPAGYALLLVSILWASTWLLTTTLVSEASTSFDVSYFFIAVAIALTQVGFFIALINLSFTTVAGTSTVALVTSTSLRTITSHPASRRTRIAHGLLLFSALSLRFEIGLLIIAILIPLWFGRISDRRTWTIPTLLVSTWTVNAGLSRLYSDPYREWLSYNAVRGSLQGNNLYNRVGVDRLPLLGWSPNDGRLFDSFLHFDIELFGRQSLELYRDMVRSGWAGLTSQLHVSDLIEAFSNFRPILVLALLLFTIFALSRKDSLAVRVDIAARIGSLLGLSVCAAAVLSQSRLPFRVSLPLVLAMLLGLASIICKSSALCAGTERYPTRISGQSRKLDFGRRAVTVALCLLASVQLQRVHVGYFSQSVSSRTERIRNAEHQIDIGDLLKSRHPEEITFLSPFTPVQHASPFAYDVPLAPRTILNGWPTHSPQWNQRNQLLKIDVTRALTSGVDLEGRPVRLSILAPNFPDTVTGYIFEKTGRVQGVRRGNCSGGFCLWHLYP